MNRRFFSLALLGAGLAVFTGATLTGCNNGSSSSSGGGSATGGAGGANEIVLVSPHPAEIQKEFETAFLAKNPGVTLQWRDLGASSTILQMLRTEYKGKGDGEGIGIDVLFGGGAETFLDLEQAKLLETLPSEYGIPADLNGMPLRGKGNTWAGAALSGFGLLYNKPIIERDKLPVPTTWADLGDPKLANRIALADPRKSGTAHMTYEIILQAYGWQRGWEVLTAMTGNARSFADGSSQILNDVAMGEAVMGPAIDFYAATKILTSEGKLAYIEPKGQNVTTADPIGILRGAPNKALAEKFVAFVLSPEGQKLFMLKKGAPGGPQNNDLYRKSILPAMYKPIPKDSLVQSNPFAAKNDFLFDPAKSSKRRLVLDDLLGSVLIDNHDAVKAGWAKTPDAKKLTFVPVSEAKASELAAKWDDQTFRNEQISQWGEAARKHFGA
jgi:ABC-type Fe3+ transport system substrate-binding protein